MAFPRGSWIALAAAPLAVATSLTAQAAPHRRADLPHGISLGDNGRYYQDVCDHDFAFPCLTMRLLPASYHPPLAGGPGGGGGAGNYCTCGSENPCGGGSTSPPEGAMTPANMLSAYTIPASTSSGGKIVAVIDMPDANALKDVNVYRKAFKIPELVQCPGNGLPDPSGGTPCFASVDENGKVTTSAGDCQASDGETGLDLDMVSAACPDCSLILVQMTAASTTDGPQDSDFITSAKSAIALGAVATSISFGGDEFGDPTGKNFTTPGHLVLVASGDAGYLNELYQGSTPSYPASAPDVLAVGGTTLIPDGSHFSEVVWNDGTQGGAGGSGCSTEQAMPAFQTTFLSTHSDAFGSCKKRATNDLAAAAEYEASFGGAIAEYDSVDGWSQVVGTSAASPMVAGILTRLNLTDSISANLGWVYENISAFNDITSGNNDPGQTCSSVLCQAGPGWDGPTGVGTPNGTKLAALAPQPAEDAGADGGDAGEETGDGGKAFGTPEKGGCGCTTASTGGEDLALFGSAVATLGAAWRRRRTRRVV